MCRGPRTILGLAAAPKWPTPWGSAISVACDAGLVAGAGLVAAVGDPADDAEPDVAEPDGADPDGAKVALAWGLVVAAPLPPKTVQAPMPATASATRAAITTSHLRTFQSLRRRRLLADTDSHSHC
jgi:hypothetical protein